MSTRKIKDAKDLSTNELIYFKGHAQATYMSDGTTVEDAINNIEVTGGIGDLNVQSDWNETDTTSDAYIKNKPTIPSAVTESTVNGWGYTKNTGTITGVSANGTSVATSGVANIPAASTSAYGVTKLSSSTSSTSTTLAATASAVKAAYDLANGKQAKLVSGTNIKTINGESILGSGNIVINSSSDETTIDNGVYAVTADEKLINYNEADESCIGVALVAGEHKFMIAKSDATNDGSNYNLYWTNNTSDLSLTNYTKSDGTNGSGYLPKPDGTFGGSTHLSDDFTTWTNGALSDFNGKANTAVIAAASSHAKDMCTVLNTFNASDSFKDWYVPACGQLALMYLNMTEINAALAKIGGTALAAEHYWSSSELSSYFAWYVYFDGGFVYYDLKGNDGYRVRFVRDISIPKPLKERVSELESSKQDTLISGTNIKTINGQSILGEGNIEITGGSSDGVDLSAYATKTDLDNYLPIYCGTTGTIYGDLTLHEDPDGSGNSNFSATHIWAGYEMSTPQLWIGDNLISSSYPNKLSICYLDQGSSYNIVTENNLKTINGESILGSGDIVISGGSSSGAYAEVNHGTGDTTFTLTPNTFHVWDEVTSLDLSFADETAGVANEYLFQFTSGARATTLTLPDGLKWANDDAPTIVENKIY